MRGTGMDGAACLLFDIDGGLARITLNRPEAYNAIDPATASAFTAAVRAVGEAQAVRAVLLTGNGPAFCAGGDVKAMAGATDRAELLGGLVDDFHEGLALLAELPWPVVAAVRGVAAGAGLGLLLCADLVIAEQSARFSTAYGAVGLSPDSGVSYHLPRIVGPARALRLSLTGEVLSASDALDWGIAAEVVPDGEGLARAEALARALAAGPQPAVAETKRLLRAATGRHLRAHLDDEARTIVRTGASADACRLIEAFATRRRERTATPAGPDRHQ
ncbi:enoyl-CoA hydratase/isomerase family protein [Phytohabitans kaempferiae]|uniref:Enoyl-CoA hydratase/isomerase family protein n=1 Tax=Phytohabitans kaempferiae TaxID=1620943 RepID=A0ABV6M696_9ACTN